MKVKYWKSLLLVLLLPIFGCGKEKENDPPAVQEEVEKTEYQALGVTERIVEDLITELEEIGVQPELPELYLRDYWETVKDDTTFIVDDLWVVYGLTEVLTELDTPPEDQARIFSKFTPELGRRAAIPREADRTLSYIKMRLNAPSEVQLHVDDLIKSQRDRLDRRPSWLTHPSKGIETVDENAGD